MWIGKGKTGKEIPRSSRLEFLEKFLANNFSLSDIEENTSGSLNRGGIADLPLLITLLVIHQKSWEPSFWEVIDSCFISICKFASFKNPFATITRLSELSFRFRRDLFCWYQSKKWFLWTISIACAHAITDINQEKGGLHRR